MFKFSIPEMKSEKVDLSQLEAAHTEVILTLKQLSRVLDQFGVYNFLDISCAETRGLKQYLNGLCQDTNEAREMLKLHLLLLNLEDSSPNRSSYDKTKIKELFNVLVFQIDERFKKNLNSIATNWTPKFTGFDHVRAKQCANNMLDGIAVQVFFQSYKPGHLSYWTEERRKNAALIQILDHANGDNKNNFFDSGVNTASILIKEFGVTKKEIREKNLVSIRIKLLNIENRNLLTQVTQQMMQEPYRSH
jgi:hypothetical protein